MEDIEINMFSYNGAGVLFEYLSNTALTTVIKNFDEFNFDENAMFNKASQYSSDIISLRYLTLVDKNFKVD